MQSLEILWRSGVIDMRLKVHTRVHHKVYGEGKITSDKNYVAFNGNIYDGQ